MRELPECSVEPLSEARIVAAFPLVSAALPDVSLDQWTQYAREMIAGADRGGPDLGRLMVVRDRKGFIHAVYQYQLRPSLADGPIMAIDLLIAAKLVSEDSMARLVLGVVEREARALGCDAVLLELPESTAGEGMPEARDRFRGGGYEPVTSAFRKRLAPRDKAVRRAGPGHAPSNLH